MYPSIRTDRVLGKAIEAMPRAAQSFGFPVEFEAAKPPANPRFGETVGNITAERGKIE
jgi:hypothetical protein